MVAPSSVQANFGVAVTAFESVDPVPAALWPQVGDHFVLNPTNGALEIAPAHRDKLAKALMREVRRMQFRLKLTLARLYLRKFVLNCRCAATRICRDVLSVFRELARV
jgi:hypothetical protein